MKKKHRFSLFTALSLSLVSGLSLALVQALFGLRLPLGAYGLSCGLGFFAGLALERLVGAAGQGERLEALRAQIEGLEAQRKRELEDLHERENYRREFIGNVAHEMRTPLFTAQSYVLTLMEGALEDKAVRGDYLRRVNRSLERLIYIIEDLSLIAKLESGSVSVQKQRFNLVDLIREVLEMMEVKAEKAKNSLGLDRAYDTPIYVFADIKRIEQVLTNLVVNAIEHGRRKGHTRLSIKETREKVWVSVSDDGEGIAQEHLPRIFERFYRTDRSRSRNKGGGSGLGLTIVKHILEAHGEQIQVESQPDKGSRFSFSLEPIKG